MIILAGEIKIKPGHRDEAVQAILPMMEASLAETGCLAYQFSAHLEELNTLVLYELWENSEALDAHGETEHMAKFRKKFGPLVDGETNLNRYQAEPITK